MMDPTTLFIGAMITVCVGIGMGEKSSISAALALLFMGFAALIGGNK